MATQQKINIGILSPATADRPHFKSLAQMLPAEVTVTNEGLGLLQDSYHHLERKTDEIAARAADFVRRNQVHGLIVTGGFVTLFNPGLEAKIADVVRIPVTSAVPSVTASLNALSVTKVMLVTPFTAEMNAHIEKHLTNLGFTVFPGPPYDKTRKPGAGVEISPDELFQRVEASYRQNPTVQAIYFQGATLDPLPVIQRLEDNLGIPVVSSNTAMFWNIVSKLGAKFSINGYGKLLSSWPVVPSQRGGFEFKDVLPRLVAAYEAGRLVPFIGVGMSRPHCADWPGLIRGLEAAAGISNVPPLDANTKSEDLIQRANRAVRKLRSGAAGEFEDALRQSLFVKKDSVPEQTSALAKIWWPLVLSTNYDDFYVKAFADEFGALGL